MNRPSKYQLLIICILCVGVWGAGFAQALLFHPVTLVHSWASPDSVIQIDPCSGRASESFSKFLTSEVDPEIRGTRTYFGLSKEIRGLVQSAERVQVLVSYDRDNPRHSEKRKAGQSRREDIILYGQNPEYFRYLLPEVTLSSEQHQAVLDLLVKPSVYCRATGLSKSTGVVSGPRYVLELVSPAEKVTVTISTMNLPSIWFSGSTFEPFGGGLDRADEQKWHRIIKKAIEDAGYD